jgi:hypothetical protein
MAEYRTDQGQTEGITQEEQVFLDRVGIVLRGAKQIAAYMGKSPATIVRWRSRFRGREEILLCFPAMLVATGKGRRLQLWSHTALIKEWMERWCRIDAASAQGKAKWRRRTPRMKRIGETRKESAGHFEGGNEQTVREAAQFGPTPAQRENLPEIPKLDVIAPETPLSTEEPRPTVDVGRPPTTQPQPALTLNPCTCGTLTPCTAHH